MALPSDTFDPTIQSEDIAFRADELVNCKRCRRPNPPDRTNCLYCGEALELAGVSDKLKIRTPEAWESGWNLVIKTAIDPKLNEASRTLDIDPEKLNDILTAGEPMPLIRVGEPGTAEAIASRLRGSGIETTVVSDEELLPDRSPTRIRTLSLVDAGILLTDFNTGGSTGIEWPDLVLLVTGVVTEHRTESLEKKRRRTKEAKIIDSSEASSDEMVVDLYSRSSSQGYRIQPAGFDFSFLGGDKSLLAADNMRRLVSELTQRTSTMKCVTTYRHVRQLLDDVWPPESRKDSKGMMRTGFGRREFGSVASVSNLTQFNKYSRLQWHLL